MKVTSQMRSPTWVTPIFWPASRVAQIDLPSLETNPAAAGDGDRVIVEGVSQLLEATIHTR